MQSSSATPISTSPTAAMVLADALAPREPDAPFTYADQLSLAWWKGGYELKRLVRKRRIPDPMHRFAYGMVFAMWLVATGRLSDES